MAYGSKKEAEEAFRQAKKFLDDEQLREAAAERENDADARARGSCIGIIAMGALGLATAVGMEVLCRKNNVPNNAFYEEWFAATVFWQWLGTVVSGKKPINRLDEACGIFTQEIYPASRRN